MTSTTMSKKKPHRHHKTRTPGTAGVVYDTLRPQAAANFRAAAVKARTLAARLDDCAKGAATFEAALLKGARFADAAAELRAALQAFDAPNLLPPGSDN